MNIVNDDTKLAIALDGAAFQAAQLEARKRIRLQAFTAALLFSLGFSLVFVAMGATAGALGKYMLAYRDMMGRASGALVILLGLFVLGLVRWNKLYSEHRFHARKYKHFTAPLAGMAFAFGWTPCVGPFLGPLLAMAAVSGTYRTGAFYLAIYSMGLALPFLVSALLMSSLLGTFGWLKRNFKIINTFAGGMLVVMGILLLTGKFGIMMSAFYSLSVADVSTTALQGAQIGIITSFVAGLLSFLSPCVLPLVPGYLSFISGVAIEDLMKSEG